MSKKQIISLILEALLGVITLAVLVLMFMAIWGDNLILSIKLTATAILCCGVCFGIIKSINQSKGE